MWHHEVDNSILPANSNYQNPPSGKELKKQILFSGDCEDVVYCPLKGFPSVYALYKIWKYLFSKSRGKFCHERIDKSKKFWKKARLFIRNQLLK